MDHFVIRQVHKDEYEILRKLDRDAFGYNERGSNAVLHEVFADNIRRSPYYIPELDLAAVTDNGLTYLGHAIFSALPMGDHGEHIVWLNSLAVRHGENDSHTKKSYEFQRKGIGTALVMHGLDIAKSLGYTGCMTCGNPAVYREKMGFLDCRALGVGRDGSVDVPEGSLFAMELTPDGFSNTNKQLSFSYYDFTKTKQNDIEPETLTGIISAMTRKRIISATYQTEALKGGTLGDVRLVTGMAKTADGGKVSYRVVLKIQKKWERPGDIESWRREYDLARGDFSAIFSESLRWPACYDADMNGDEIRIWMEFIEGASGSNLTTEALEKAAREWGRLQGRLYRKPEFLQNVPCLGDAGFMEREYGQWKPETVEYRYLRSDECILPEHLRRMLIDTQRQAEEIFTDIRRLPVVLCHRDLWIENIFLWDGEIILIDWDCAGWGYLGEDIASLIADDTAIENLDEYYRKLIPAYRRGLSEYMDSSLLEDRHIREMIVIKFGYRILQKYMFAQSSTVKDQQVIALQKIYEMGL